MKTIAIIQAREADRRYYWAHREERLSKKAAWLARNRDEVNRKKRLTRAENPELARMKGRENYRKNRGNTLAYARAHQHLSIQHNRLKNTGMDAILFHQRLHDQNHACAICSSQLTDSAHADHDHSTKRPRGVLCRNCNLGLGYFADDSERIQRAAEYLLSWRNR